MTAQLSPKKIRVVAIGAGSVGFGRGIITGLMASKALKDRDLTLSLVDKDKVALDVVAQFAELVKKHYGSHVTIETSTDREQALKGANYVVNAVARRRMELWAEDFFVPAAFGFPQALGENGGPGGAFHTLRSIHLILPVCKDIERICPQAHLINYSNPQSRVSLAISKCTAVSMVGLCHGPFETLDKVAEIMKRPAESIEIDLGGINHFHWMLKISDRQNDRDLYPQFHNEMQKTNVRLDPLTRRLYETFGLFPIPSGGHTSEYVSFGYNLLGPTWLWGVGKNRDLYLKENPNEGRRTYYTVTLESLRNVISGREPLTPNLVQPPTSDIAVPIICDIELDRKQRELAVNIPNQGLAIANLPEDAIVEVPAMVDARGIHPIPVGPLPNAIAAMCHLQISIQQLLVEAYQKKSRKILLQALLLDPLVNDADKAEKMMNELLRVEADYLPELQ